MKEPYIIHTQALSKTFGHRTVLNQIELKIEPGEIFGLLGPSGAGKTTLIQLLAGQLNPTSGHGVVMHDALPALSRDTLSKIGIMSDYSGLYERLSCFDNLNLFAKIYGCDPANILQALEQVGLEDAVRLPVHKLSRGMRQRLIFARAVFHKPTLLFLDEPTASLDPVATRNMHKLIREQQKRGVTIFLTTHNMEEAAKLCGRVALLYNGKIVECGIPEQLCQKYDKCRTLQIQLRSKERIQIPNSRESAEKVQTLFASGQVESIHSSEPDLESVFVELTGRNLA